MAQEFPELPGDFEGNADNAAAVQPTPKAMSWRMRWMRLCGQLMRARKASGLTQDEAAGRLDVSRSTFQRWERGDAEPTAIQLFRWADLVGVDITSEPRA